MVEDQPKWRTGKIRLAEAEQIEGTERAGEITAPAGETVDLAQMMDLATPWCLHVAATQSPHPGPDSASGGSGRGTSLPLPGFTV